MNKELNYLAGLAGRGHMDRRAFFGRAAALGASTVLTTSLFNNAVLAAGPRKGGTMKLGVSGGQTSDSLDPALAANNVAFSVLRLYGDALVDVTADGSLDYRLVTDIKPSSDATVWTFTIRNDVSFHNGAKMTPEDVAATLKRHLNPDAKSGAFGVLQSISGVEVSGGDVVVTCKEPNADLPFILSDYHLVIQPGGGVDAPDAGIGTGPYKVTRSEHGVQYNFEKFADYYDDTRAHVDAIELTVVNDETARVSALQSGQVHIVNGIPPKVAGLMERVPTVDVHSIGGRGFYCMNMFTNTAPFDNNDLRLALKYALDREQMVEQILYGHGTLGNDTPINAAYPFFSSDIPQRAFDPEKAAEHYKKSGHSGPIVLRTAETAFPGAIDAAQLFQNSAAKCGITIEIKREPNDGYWSEVWNKQPFHMSYWGGRPTQDSMFSTAYYSTAEWNDTRFNNAEFDKKLLTARGETDQAKRKGLYHDMGMLLRDEGGLIVPMFNNWLEGSSKDVAGWVDDPNQVLSNGYAAVKTWLIS
ncbi:ABC transporter substrate-binding protein [Kiloniella sp. b19]|uniref:ABC transporter substrate-binding protein n=1 Tax=Kiloniella sp. GXU_MW_B19 TaxID=3141326 RepID=UPI0031D5BDC3